MPPVIASDFDGVFHNNRNGDTIGKPIKSVLEYLQEQRNQGATITIITRRPSSDKKLIQTFLKKHKLFVDKIIFTESDRIDILKNLHATTYLDDRLENLRPIHKSLTHIFMLAHYSWKNAYGEELKKKTKLFNDEKKTQI